MRRVFITGASTGIGEALARHYAGPDVALGLFARRRELLLDKDRLHAIGLQHEQSWATGNRLRDMQGPPKMARAEAHAKKAEGEA